MFENIGQDWVNRTHADWWARVQAALGEQVVLLVGVAPAGQGDAGRSGRIPGWQPAITVNGQPHTPIPHAMGLVITPTRLIITSMSEFQSATVTPILTLYRGDAEISATKNAGGSKWTFSLRSRAHGAELDVETITRWGIPDYGDQAAELLCAFSATPTRPTIESGTEPVGFNRRTATAARRKSLTVIGICVLLGSLLFFGIAGYQTYAYNVGTPTTAKVESCTGSKSVTCRGTWTVDGVERRGVINGVDESQEGTRVVVHVFHRTAYSSAWSYWYMPAVMAGVGGLVLLSLPFWRSVLRRSGA